MSRFRIAAPVALVGALGLVGIPTLAGSISHSAPVAAAENPPVATAVGGDAGPLVYPSMLNTRLVRADAALERLTEAVDENNAAGAQTALTLDAELGDLKRFGSAKQLCAYAGLVPRVADSADRQSHGPLTKGGNTEVRWIVGQWALRLLASKALST